MTLYRARLRCLSLARTWLWVTIHVRAETEFEARHIAYRYFGYTVRPSERTGSIELTELHGGRVA